MKKISNKKRQRQRQRQRQYQDKYNREFPYSWFRYCKEPLEDIQGWSEMISDTSGQPWHLHHRAEIQDDIVVSSDELRARGQYLNLPADKLIFMTEFAHKSLHHTGKNHSGKHNPMYGKNKYEITEEDLHELYVVQRLTQLEIADKIGCCRIWIGKYLKKFGISRK